MKKITSMVLFLLIAAVAKGQLFKNMDKGIGYAVMTSCIDSKGNVTVISHKGVGLMSVDIFTKTTGKWTNYSSFYGDSTDIFRSIYKNDSLYVLGSINSVEGLYYVSPGNAKRVGRFKYKNFYNATTNFELKIIGKFILVTGYFDSVQNANNQSILSNRVVLFNGTNWVKSNLSNNTITTDGIGFYNPKVDVVNDTAMVFAGNGLYRFIAPNNWVKLNVPFALNIVQMGHFKNNKFYYLTYNNDTLYNFTNNGVFSKLKTNFKTNSYQIGSSCTFQDKIYIVNLTDNWLYRLNANQFQKVYELVDTAFSRTAELNCNDSHIYLGEPKPIYHSNKYYSYFAELIADSVKVAGIDTIFGQVFWDRNSNGIKDGIDVLVSWGYVRNMTNLSRYLTYVNNGEFQEFVPDYNDVEYELSYTQYDTCLKQSFSGNVKSRNTRPGISRDTVFFPLKRTSLTLKPNLILKGYTQIRQRLLDSNMFYFKISKEDCDIASVNATLTIKIDKDYTITGSKPAYTSKTGNELTYNLTGISNYTPVYVVVKGYYSNTKYSIGQTIKHSSKITTSFTEDTTDNKDTFSQKLVYSYDPNNKQSIPEGVITQGLKSIRYCINFQNEGNDEARRVTIVDTLNLRMPVYEFQMIGATHSYTTSIQNNVVTWVFENINLKPKSENDKASKGFLVFEAKVRSDLKAGDSIRNRAHIYFDYNSPVITNYAVVSRWQPGSGIKDEVISKSLTLYPNPTTGNLYIKNAGNQSQNAMIYDMKGSLIKTVQLNLKSETLIITEGWSKGIYLLRTNLGESIKFVAE